MSTIALQTKFVKNNSETVVTFIGTEMRDGIERARFQSAHGGIVSLTMTTFLERYSPYTESKEPEAEITPLALALAAHGINVKPDGTLSNKGCEVNCPTDLVELYLEQFPLKPQFDCGDGIHDVFMNHRPGSCMGYDNDDCQVMRSLYADNYRQVSIIYFELDSHYLLSGSVSALVWHTKTNLWIDRIYKDGFRAVDFESVLRKHVQRFCEEKWSGLVFEKPRYIDLDWDVDNPLPYIDTFYHAEDTEDGQVRLWPSAQRNTTVCRCQNGTVIAEQRLCANCSCRMSEDDSQSDDNGNEYCESCFDELYAYDDLSDSYVSVDDIESLEVYRQGRIRTMYTTRDSLRSDYTECHDDSCADWVHDNDRIELVDGDYICLEDLENGNYVETVDGDVMPVGDAYYYDDEYHTDEQETPDDDDDSDDEPIAIDPTEIMFRVKCDDGLHTIPAYKVGEFLAVHLRYNTSSRDTKVWEVSHIPTGMRIWRDECPTKQAAIDRANKLLASLAIGGIANGMITTASPCRLDPVAVVLNATSGGIPDRTTVNIYRNVTKTINYSVLATV